MNKFQLLMMVMGVIAPMLADNKITIGEIADAVTAYLKESGLYGKVLYEVK